MNYSSETLVTKIEDIVGTDIFDNPKTPIGKVRVYERNRSYEDYSISHTLDKRIIFNFNVSEEKGVITIAKKDKRSSRHIQFSADSGISFEVVTVNKKRLLKMFVDGYVQYTDGTHRYEKEENGQ